MRLFWKVFLILILTLLFTAAVSTWLSQTWMQQNKQVEMRLNTLSDLGETAITLYEQEGASRLHQWLRQSIRKQRIRGTLIDAQGIQLSSRPLSPELQQLAQRAAKTKEQVNIIHLPRLATATPIQSESGQFIWIASTHLRPEQMREGSRQMLVIRIAIFLLALALVSWFLTRIFTGPIRQLQKTAEQLGEGSLNTTTPEQLSTRRDELGDLARSFDTMAGQLNNLVHSHKQLLRDISHELRSPLARLQVALELARNESDGKADAEFDRIALEAERLNALIGEVLTLARFEQGAVETSITPLQLDELLQEIATDAAFEAEAMGKRVECTELTHCDIKADRLWIGSALDNVIRNAVRHTNSDTAVEISLQMHHSNAIITICDHGEGVSDSDLPQLFEPFFRASEARERHSPTDNSGYGLGLAIAKRAIVLHGGDINAGNHPEGGLLVTITLPVTA